MIIFDADIAARVTLRHDYALLRDAYALSMMR